MLRIPVVVMSVALFPTSFAVAAEKKAETEKTHPDHAHITKFVELARAGKLKEADRLSKPKAPGGDRWQIYLNNLKSFTAKEKGKIAIREVWASDATAWAAFPPSDFGARKKVLTIFARKIDGKWYVENFVVYRPERWEKDQQRYVKEYKAKRIHLAKSAKKKEAKE